MPPIGTETTIYVAVYPVLTMQLIGHLGEVTCHFFALYFCVEICWCFIETVLCLFAIKSVGAESALCDFI